MTADAVSNTPAFRILTWYHATDSAMSKVSDPAALIAQDFASMAELGVRDVLLFYQRDYREYALAEASRSGLRIHLICLHHGIQQDKAEREVIPREAEYRKEFEYTGAGFRVCPSSATNRGHSVAGIEAACKEHEGRIAGIHLDGFRYANTFLRENYPCECPACQEHRLPWLGHGVLTEEDRANPSVMYKEIEFKNRVITDWLLDIRKVVKPRGLTLSLAARAVYVDRDVEFNRIGPAGYGPAVFEGQDWPQWCRQGLLDFVCPMNYTNSMERFERLTRQHVAAVGGAETPIYEGLGVRSSAGQNTPDDVAKQIDLLKRLGLTGFTIFPWSAVDQDIAELLRPLTSD